MGCLCWFKRTRRSRSGGSSSSTSGKRGASAPVSVSGPATTTMTTTTVASAVSTSRSDDSGAVRPVSKSAGSAGSSQLSQRSISSLYEERGHGQLRVFDYAELQAASAEFSRAQKLGEGGFGSVYKGFIRAADGRGDRGIPVAIKKLNQRGMQLLLLCLGRHEQKRELCSAGIWDSRTVGCVDRISATLRKLFRTVSQQPS